MTYRVLVTEVSHDGQYFVGHNGCYEQVLVPKKPEIMGKLVNVKIISICKFSMTGILIDDAEIINPNEVKPLQKGKLSGSKKKKDEKSFMDQFLSVCIFVVLGLAVFIRLYYFTAHWEFFTPPNSSSNSPESHKTGAHSYKY